MYEIGIRHLIFFKRKELRSKLQSISPRLNRIQIRINRNSPLTVQQIDRFIDVVEQANNEKEVCFELTAAIDILNTAKLVITLKNKILKMQVALNRVAKKPRI